MPIMDIATEHYQKDCQRVAVTTAARLHMGFFDLSQSSSSGLGGLGLAIDSPYTQVQIANSKELDIDAYCSENVVKIVENYIKLLSIPKAFSLKVLQKIPEHAGFGSGTQMALAIGVGLNQVFRLNLSAAQIAAASLRGKRSAIGLGAFSQGGFLIDLGKTSQLPTIDVRIDFPNDWRLLLVQDSRQVGVHDTVESEAFKTLKPAQMHLKTMLQQHMLPALQRADLLAFGAYMQDLQAYNGDYFAPAQGGRYASQDVAEALTWLQANGAACVGQSSWGPTGFAILENQQQAASLQNQAQQAFVGKSNISFNIVRGRNTGAIIEKSSF